MHLALREHEYEVGDPNGKQPGQLVLNADLIWRVSIAVVALLIAAGVAVEILRVFYGHERILGLHRQFNLDDENNIPTWFSTIGLLACAVVLGFLAAVHRKRRDPPGHFFAALAAGFVMLSLDEAASFHEMLLKPMKYVFHADGFLYFAWVIPGIAFACGVAVWSWNSLKKLPSDTRFAILASGIVYCTGALGVEMIAGQYLTATHTEAIMKTNKDFVYSLLAITEESLEMIGTVLFLRALVDYFVRTGGSVTIQVKSRLSH